MENPEPDLDFRSYLDPFCGPSGRAFRSITDNVLPLIEKGGIYHERLSLVLRPFPNPVYVKLRLLFCQITGYIVVVVYEGIKEGPELIECILV